MELYERIALILRENELKQKQLAEMLGVTESYISALLNQRSNNPSKAFANLIEEKLGYNAEWILTGNGSKFSKRSNASGLSEIHRKVIFQVERMPEEHLKAILAFIDSLDRVEAIFRKDNN